MSLPAAGIRALERVFDSQIELGLHYGAQLAVRLHGEVVFERAGGWVDMARKRAVRLDTPFMVFSVTKAFTAICIHKLAEEGLVDLDAPLANYWHAFGKKGKGGISLRQVLLHQGGFPGRLDMLAALPLVSTAWAARNVANLVPIHGPGQACHYHFFTAGIALGEVIRSVTGESAASYLKRTFLGPLGMTNSFPGLPPSEYGRSSRIHSGDPEQQGAALYFSNPLTRSRFVPAASLNTTASDITRFYAMLCAGGNWHGSVLLSPSTIAEATMLRYDGPDGDTGKRIRWTEGFTLGGYSTFRDEDIRMMGKRSTERTFGHSGQGGCAIGWADPDSGLAFAFTCNRFLEAKTAVRRFEELADAAWEAFAPS